MRLVNRTAITILGRTPYQEWARGRDADFARNALTVARTRTHGGCVLRPQFSLAENLLEWVEDNHAWLFEFQLAMWTDDESAWPQARDVDMFRQWFRVDIHDTVVDASDEDIEIDEL